MKKTGPISPDEALESKDSTIPPEVFEAFNELLTERAADYVIVIGQDEAIERIIDLMTADSETINARVRTAKRREIFDHQWLDVERFYQKAGWKVDYDKPGYNETYEACWTFYKKRRGR